MGSREAQPTWSVEVTYDLVMVEPVFDAPRAATFSLMTPHVVILRGNALHFSLDAQQ